MNADHSSVSSWPSGSTCGRGSTLLIKVFKLEFECLQAHSSNIVLLFSVTYNYDGEPYVINHTEEKGRVTVNLVRYGIYRNHCFRNF